jgi:cytochrome c oxidase subunit 2
VSSPSSLESFDPVTRQGLSITNLFVLELAISGILLLLVAVVLVLSVVRFKERRDDATEPPQVHGHRGLEIAWTVTPALVLAVVFALVIETMRTVDASPPRALPLRIVGHQWWWEYEYPNLQVITANELHVPVGTPLQVSLQSADVIHSFHVPMFGLMRDAVPTRTNSMAILVDRPGTYDGTCNQYCGLQHAWMRVIAVAEPEAQFNAWVQQQLRPTAASGARGEQVFLQNTCVNCHAISGLSPHSPRIGPDLTHLGSRATLGTGIVQNTPATLRAWIRNASAIKPGVLMPSFPNLSESDLTALADYLASLN